MNITLRRTCLLLTATLLTALVAARPTAPVAAASTASAAALRPAASKYCTPATQQKYVSSLAAQIRVPAPFVAVDAAAASGAYFTPRSSTIMVRPGCVSKSMLAHEFGHYVVDLAAGKNWAEHQMIAQQFTGYRNWLKNLPDTEGFERAAHCVGYRFVKNGTYTRCPHRKARDLAAYVTAAAANRYPA